MTDLQEHLAAVLDTHFDPQWGSAFWLERRAALDFDPCADIHTADDLIRFPPFPLDELARRPITDSIPRRFHDQLQRFVTSESGGATGPPKRTAFLDTEFAAAFVTPFVEAARLVGFPRGGAWLFIGPSGPHVIGKAARACAIGMDAIDPFTVDFDPRWVRKFPADSMGRSRYTEHVLSQADAVLASQEITVLFATPPVLAALGERMPQAQRDEIQGVHLGGMAADAAFWSRLTTEWFPHAVALSGYGNSLAGVSPQIAPDRGRPPEYFSHGPRLILDVDATTEGERGRVRFHRLDQSAFLPNVLERDEALRVAKPSLPGSECFQPFGLHDPRPPAHASATLSDGLY